MSSSRKSAALVTWASGKQFCESPYFNVYVNSARRIDAERFIYTCEMPEEIQSRLSGDFKIITVPKYQIGSVLRDRNYFFWQFCLESRHDLVLVSDAKDVIFQDDPFMDVDGVLLTEEGMLHEQSPWNINEQKQVQKNLREFFTPFRKDPVVNAGVYLGKPQHLKGLFLLIWSNALRVEGCTDQAVLNYLVNYLRRDPIYQFASPFESRFCLTGEAVKERFVAAMFNGKFLYPKSGLAYQIVHQWDRTEYRDRILSQYSD